MAIRIKDTTVIDDSRNFTYAESITFTDGTKQVAADQLNIAPDFKKSDLTYTLDNPNAYSTSLDDYFGNSIAISGNYAIVGAQQEDDAGGTESGKVYIFNVTTGALLHTLDNPNPYSTSENDRFGKSVAISSNYVIVGAHQEDDPGGNGSGKAYIFSEKETTYLDKLLALVE